jgi:uncharacterized protein
LETRPEGPGLEEKKRVLRRIVGGMGPALVAFSGGVDSALLLRVAAEELPGKVRSVTLSSPLHPAWEVRDAADTAKALGVPHAVVESRHWEDPVFLSNKPGRCYRCKQLIMSQLLELARGEGLAHVMEGSHAGDRWEDRPGMRALAELGIRSPLREAGLDKAEIRAWAREMGMAQWDRPAMACLATRIPAGERITLRKLERVRVAEERLMEMGFRQFRARYRGDAVVIEVGQEEVGTLLAEGLRRRLMEEMGSVGFRHVWLDLRGYVEKG